MLASHDDARAGRPLRGDVVDMKQVEGKLTSAKFRQTLKPPLKTSRLADRDTHSLAKDTEQSVRVHFQASIPHACGTMVEATIYLGVPGFGHLGPVRIGKQRTASLRTSRSRFARTSRSVAMLTGEPMAEEQVASISLYAVLLVLHCRHIPAI